MDDARQPEPLSSQNVQRRVPARAARIGRLRSLLLIGAPLLVILAALAVYLSGGRYVETENAYVKADRVSVSADVEGPIVAVGVAENQHVAPGDILFRIDDASFRIALARADAELAAARTELEGMKASYRQKADELGVAQTNANFASRTLERQRRLAATSAVSQAAFDEAQRDSDVARQQIAVIRQEMAQIRAQLAGDPDITVENHPRYRAALAARDSAALDLAHATVRAPFAGIASMTPKVGQYVMSGTPVMSVVADRGMWIEANFKETELTHVRPGQPVEIAVDTYPGRHWKGTVQSISPASASEFSVLPAQNATGNWVKVVQRIPVRIAVAPEAGAPALRVGMSTTVEIDTERQSPLAHAAQAALSWAGTLFRPGTAHAGNGGAPERGP